MNTSLLYKERDDLVKDGLGEQANPIRDARDRYLPFATVQASATRGASNKKARQVLNWSPIYPSWREGFVQAAQEWGKQKGMSETEEA